MSKVVLEKKFNRLNALSVSSYTQVHSIPKICEITEKKLNEISYYYDTITLFDLQKKKKMFIVGPLVSLKTSGAFHSNNSEIFYFMSI